jgi:serine/alanine adding enzyme
MVTIVNSLPEDKWRCFVDQHPAGNIFHLPEMYHVFNETRNHLPEIWAAVNGDQAILALMPVVNITVMPGLVRRLSTRAVVYGGVLCEESEAGYSALGQLLSEYKKRTGKQTLFTEIRNISPADSCQTGLVKAGFGYEDHLNYLVDLNRPVEDVFLSIGNRTRKNIRRGLRQGVVTIREVQTGAQIRQLFSVLQKTFQAARIPLADISLLESAAEILLPKNMIRFTVASVKENPAAVSVELLYRGSMYGWYGGTDRTFAAYIPNELLTWSLLKWGVENGYYLYDFGGAGRPDQEYGVRDYKAKFGGELVCYGRNTWVSNPFSLVVSKLGYSLYRRIFLRNDTILTERNSTCPGSGKL